MLRPRPGASSWVQNLDLPSGIRERSGSDYELYEEEDAFILAIEMPGFNTDDISLSWDDGVLNVAAEHVDDDRDRRKTFHRRFRFPKRVDEDAINAEYTNGVLEVELPIKQQMVSGKEIEVQ